MWNAPISYNTVHPSADLTVEREVTGAADVLQPASHGERQRVERVVTAAGSDQHQLQADPVTLLCRTDGQRAAAIRYSLVSDSHARPGRTGQQGCGAVTIFPTPAPAPGKHFGPAPAPSKTP